MSDTQTRANPQGSFSAFVPNLQVFWDSTSLGALKKCPRYYQYNIIFGYTSRNESPHLRFGIEFGNAMVIYQKAKADGANSDEATIAAVKYALTQTWDTVLDRPWTSDEPTKNRETLIRSIIWYLDTFAEDSLETVIQATTGKPEMELSFRIPIDYQSSLSDEEYVLCGYLDRKVNFVGSQWITDYKTSKSALDERYFDQYTPNNQVSQYAFAGHVISHEPVAGVIIDAIQVGVTFSRFQRSQITRPIPILEEWLDDAKIYIRQNETYVRQNYWPQNDTACQQYGGCVFRAVCGMIPTLRQRHLDSLFVKRIWDPLVIREI